MRQNEVLDTVVHELETRELDYKIERLAKHIRVSWMQNGKPKCQLIPGTSGDVRARLNARAQVRRELNGYVPPPKGKLAKALELPAPSYDVRSHLDRLEQRVEELTELMLEFMAPREKQSSRDRILETLSFTEYMRPVDIAYRAGLDKANVSQTLMTLKREGLVMSGGYGQWRKMPVRS